MNLYDHYILPHIIDLACGIRPVARQRQKVIPLAQGKVLEIGIGTGLNMPFYAKDRVEKIVGVDPALKMHSLAQKRVQAAGLQVELVGLSAERLPLADASFDTVVCTYTLCSIPEPLAALAEMRRVLKPGGKLMVLEFSKVWKPLQPLYDLYSFQMLPRMGDLVTKDAESYRYLAESIRMHPDQETLKGMMEGVGFQKVDYFNMTAGVVALHVGYKL